MTPEQPGVRAGQSVLRQHGDGIEQGAADIVVEIFGVQLLLPTFGKALTHVFGEFLKGYRMTDRMECPLKQFRLRHFRYDFRFSSGRSGSSHKYGGTSVETSFEKIAEA